MALSPDRNIYIALNHKNIIIIKTDLLGPPPGRFMYMQSETKGHTNSFPVYKQIVN